MTFPIMLIWLVIVHPTGAVTIPFDTLQKCQDMSTKIKKEHNVTDSYCVPSSLDLPF